jgi:MYXO-CTERM domain-containing protein
VTCTVTGGNAGIDILWRAAYNPVIAEAGVTLDASGSGEFLFMVPAAALGEELTVELVDWIAPVSLGMVGGPVPTSVPSGEGPVPAWSLVLAVLIALGLLRRRAFGSVEG